LLAARVSTLGRDLRSRLANFLSAHRLGTMEGTGAREAITVANGRQSNALFLCNRLELEILRDVLLDDEYEPGAIPHPEVILDLGSNIGTSVVFLRHRFPDARIIGVEPDPATFPRLERNVRGVRGVSLIQAAVSAEDGWSAFRSEQLSPLSSLASSPSRAGPTVRTSSIDSILAEAGVSHADLVKIDVEGSEYEALKAFSGLRWVNTIVGEFHPPLAGKKPDKFFELLRGFEVKAVRRSPNKTSFWAVRFGGGCDDARDVGHAEPGGHDDRQVEPSARSRVGSCSR